MTTAPHGANEDAPTCDARKSVARRNGNAPGQSLLRMQSSPAHDQGLSRQTPSGCPCDQAHKSATQASRSTFGKLVTTEYVLVEVAHFPSRFPLPSTVTGRVHGPLSDPNRRQPFRTPDMFPYSPSETSRAPSNSRSTANRESASNRARSPVCPRRLQIARKSCFNGSTVE
jgi:hypothetical protein